MFQHGLTWIFLYFSFSPVFPLFCLFSVLFFEFVSVYAWIYCRKIALETLFQLCDWDIFRRVRNWDILERFVDEEDQIEAFNSIATDIDENAKYCAWHRRTSCDEYFRPIITNEGRCFTFVTIPFFFISLLTFSHFFCRHIF